MNHTQKILAARAQLYSLISLSYKVHINTIKVHLHQENMRLPSKQLPAHISDRNTRKSCEIYSMSTRDTTIVNVCLVHVFKKGMFWENV